MTASTKTTTTYLVTGVNRGLGLSFLKKLAADKSNIVIGTVRGAKAAEPVLALGLENVKLLYIDMSESYNKFESEFAQLNTLAPNGVDVVILNAGYDGPNFFPPAENYDVDAYADIFAVNVGGTAKAYKALHPHIFRGTNAKKIVFLSSIAGSTGNFILGANAYGASKAAVNHLGVQIAKGNASSTDDLIKNSTTILLHPGFVDTAMAIEPKKVFGADSFISPDQSAETCIEVIESIGVNDTGKFLDNMHNELTY